MATPQINYLSRDYASIREDLINYLKAFFPDQWQDFNVSSPGMALLELNAYVGDILSYVADKKFNELFIDGITERKSAYRLAKTLGYSIPGVRPALTLADITIEVPVTADGPDPDYLPIFRPGVQIKGAGQVFETTAEVDFSRDFSETGDPNRIIQPILNGNQDLIRYRIVKEIKDEILIYYPENMFILIPLWCRFSDCSNLEDLIVSFTNYKDAHNFINMKRYHTKMNSQQIVEREIYRVE